MFQWKFKDTFRNSSKYYLLFIVLYRWLIYDRSLMQSSSIDQFEQTVLKSQWWWRRLT